jgi:ABC-2 type transport system ATP-binding protein
MSDTVAVRLENLSKAFGSRKKQVRAVSQINLEVQGGQVFGFLGPNGAGKTTTIRMMMDLIRPTTGRVLIYGQPVQGHPRTLQRVGALVEDATFYNYLSGRRNLEVLANTGGYPDQSRIDELLEQVGMSDRAHRKVKGFSTGMKQRLGLAAALLNDPDLVVLDEPTNGLDPAGIQEMRYFIRDLAHKQGKTVFLSSHLLSEVEQVCDRVAIINQGEIVREGAVSDLLSHRAELRIEALPLDRAASVLAERWKVEINTGWLTVEASREDAPHIVRRLAEQDVDVYQVTVRRQTLEEYFMDATANAAPEEPHA